MYNVEKFNQSYKLIMKKNVFLNLPHKMATAISNFEHIFVNFTAHSLIITNC